MQEHPEHLTDEQLQQVLNDEQMQELVEQMAFTKRAFVQEEETPISAPSVADEWAKFATSHYNDDTQSRFRFGKIAASFTGVLLASGIALAAIHIVRQSVGGDLQSPYQEVQISTSSQNALLSDTTKTDTITMEPRVFDNVTLETMLTEIAAVHHVGISFENKEARELRFHFVWKREDSLDRIVEKLNTFEAVNIVVENEKLVVR